LLYRDPIVAAATLQGKRTGPAISPGGFRSPSRLIAAFRGRDPSLNPIMRAP